MLTLLAASALALDPDLAQFEGLVGRWTRGSSSETWVDAGDRLYGVAFSHEGSEPYWEVMYLSATDAGVDLVALPLGGAPVRFRATGDWTFRAPEHDYPQWIAYERKGAKLRASIGDPEQQWKWKLAPPAPDEGLVRAELAFAADVAARGVDAWMDAFAPDGWMAGATPVTGDVMRRRMSEVLAGGSLAWEPVASGLADDGELGFTVGTSVYTPADGSARIPGTYVTIWRRQPDGTWKVLFDNGG